MKCPEHQTDISDPHKSLRNLAEEGLAKWAESLQGRKSTERSDSLEHKVCLIFLRR